MKTIILVLISILWGCFLGGTAQGEQDILLSAEHLSNPVADRCWVMSPFNFKNEAVNYDYD